MGCRVGRAIAKPIRSHFFIIVPIHSCSWENGGYNKNLTYMNRLGKQMRRNPLFMKPAIQYISNEIGYATAVIVPIEIWRTINETNTQPSIQTSEWNTLDSNVYNNPNALEALLKTEATKLNRAEEKAFAEEGIEDYANLTGEEGLF